MVDHALDLIGGRDDSADDRDFERAEAVRIAGAIPVLVMRGDALNRVRRQRQLAGSVGAVYGVLDQPVDHQPVPIAHARGDFLRGERGQRSKDHPLIADDVIGKAGAGGDYTNIVEQTGVA
jgi:hypothetical protein